MDLLNSQEDPPFDGGSGKRVSALERGSAAAFSASFGADAKSKKEAEQVRLQQSIDKTLKAIDAKLTVTKI